MKVFYFCSTGKGPSAIAAAIHLGILPPDEVPQAQVYEKIPFIGARKRKRLGEVVLIGNDEFGNSVYTMGLGREKGLLKKALRDLIKITDKVNECILIDTCFAENKLLRWGQRLSGGLGLFLYATGSRKQYKELSCTVRHTLKELERSGLT